MKSETAKGFALQGGAAVLALGSFALLALKGRQMVP
jgi:hypothetical protein